MSSTNKALIILMAIAAFTIGVLLNSTQIAETDTIDAISNAELTDKDNQLHRVGDQFKQLTLINFWASWCAPCRHEMPMFENIYRSNQDRDFQIIGIALDTVDKTQAMLDSMDITYPILYAELTGMQLMADSGNPNGLLPYSILVDKNGEVIEQILGAINTKKLTEWLEKYL